MKEVSITWKPKKSSISQVHSSGLEYAFVSEDWKQVNQLVYCKDFMQDALCAVMNQKKMSIYGFSYDPKTSTPIYLKKTRLLVANWRDKTMPNRIENSIDFIRQIEKALKMSRTQVYSVTNLLPQFKKSGAYVYEAARRWQNSPPLISLYTLLIRVSLVHTAGQPYTDTIDKVCKGEIEPYLCDDRWQLQSAKTGLNWIIKIGDKKLFSQEQKDNFKDVGVSTMHNNCGICGFSNKEVQKQFPTWYNTIKEAGV